MADRHTVTFMGNGIDHVALTSELSRFTRSPAESGYISYRGATRTPFLDLMESTSQADWMELCQLIRTARQRIRQDEGYWLPMHLGGHFVRIRDVEKKW